MRLVIHAAEEMAECEIQANVFRIPPNRAFKVNSIFDMDHNNNGPIEVAIPEEVVCQKLLDRCWFYGLTEVAVVEIPGEFGPTYTYDVPAALVTAKERLLIAEDQILGNYVKTAQERMSQQLPASPPNGRAKYVIEKRKIDLKKEFNITPVGYGQVAKAASHQDEIDELKRQNADLLARFNRLMESMEPESAGAGRKGK